MNKLYNTWKFPSLTWAPGITGLIKGPQCQGEGDRQGGGRNFGRF